MPLIGSTIILRMEFYDPKTNELCDPVDINIKMYNNMRRQVGETIVLTEENRVDLGIYECSYVIPEGRGRLTYEISATIDNNPVVYRGYIERVFVEG